MFERYTVHAQQAMAVAQEQALLLGHDHVGTEHLLLGLLKESEGAAAKLLDLEGVSFESVRQKVEDNAGQSESTSTGSPPLTPRAKKVLQLALRQALGSGNDHVGTEHILLGLLREGHGVGVGALVGLGVDLNGLPRPGDRVSFWHAAHRPGRSPRRQGPERPRSARRQLAA